ncbi:MAG: hypothetical protein J5I91_01255 [Bacteroidetes bacterium]|nr:hypothetical protein [Bacteroidota bacterium]
MKKTFLILTTAMSFMFFSCANNTSKDTEHEHEDMEEHAEHHHDSEEDSETIELNNGEKWKVNEEMKPFIINGEALVEKYINENSTDYKKLAKDLDGQNQNLIKSCTMDGKSHDELHKWLHPHLELVKELEEEDDNAEAIALIHKIHASYLEFHQYFQ